MKKNIETLLSYFEKRNRDNGDTFFCLKSNTPDYIGDLIKDIHGTDIFPDDFRYKTIWQLLNALNEYDLVESGDAYDRDLDWQLSEELISCYNSDLLQWLASNLNRIYFVNEAMADYGNMGHEFDLINSIRMGQFQEIREIMHRLLNVLDNEV